MTGEEKGTGKVRGRSVVWPLLLALRFQVDKRNLTDVEKNERRRRRKVGKGAGRSGEWDSKEVGNIIFPSETCRKMRVSRKMRS